ncbi:MAG: SEL1-like repeat protein [Clostridia bacterium]|nr:SEL1-like repeat protein [Clostridia bacterium]
MDIYGLILKAQEGDANAQYELAMRYARGDGVEANAALKKKWLLEAAEKGNADAAEMLGTISFFDEHDYKSAVHWYEKAANGGSAEGLRSLAFFYDSLGGEMCDAGKAAHYYEKLAERGDSSAQTKLSEIYEAGNGVERNDDKALYWLKKAAEGDDAKAQCLLGERYEKGYGVERDEDKAAYWYVKAGEQDDIALRMAFGTYYLGDDAESRRKNAEIAKLSKRSHWLRKAADLGSVRAKYLLGELFTDFHSTESGSDPEEGLRLLTEAAENGLPEAQESLGWKYRAGAWALGNAEQKDTEKAYYWLKKAADSGRPKAVRELGELYLDKDFSRRDPKKALKLLNKGMEMGDEYAPYELGKFYLGGVGAEKDIKKAVLYFEKAADAGNSLAMMKLAEMFGKGEEVEKDLKTAVKWAQAASDKKAFGADDLLKELRREREEHIVKRKAELTEKKKKIEEKTSAFSAWLSLALLPVFFLAVYGARWALTHEFSSSILKILCQFLTIGAGVVCAAVIGGGVMMSITEVLTIPGAIAGIALGIGALASHEEPDQLKTTATVLGCIAAALIVMIVIRTLVRKKKLSAVEKELASL